MSTAAAPTGLNMFDIPLCDMEADYACQTMSGPHKLTPEMRQKHKDLQALAKNDLPIYDNFKKSDCDLLYRYLIARKWDVKAAAEAIRENNLWRQKHKINTILKERLEDWGDMPRFMGVDKDGSPVMYNAPNTQVIVNLLKTKSKDDLIRRHFVAMERARYLCRKHNSDRVSCVLDLTHVGMSGITQAVAFLKDLSSYDQKYYPETMRRMIVCNGGWAITGAWKGIRNFIDPRTQQKISFVSGPPSAKVLQEYIELSQIPKEYGGMGDPNVIGTDFDALLDCMSPLSAPSLGSGFSNSGRQNTDLSLSNVVVQVPSSPSGGPVESASEARSTCGRSTIPPALQPVSGAGTAKAMVSPPEAGSKPFHGATLVAHHKFESPRLADEGGANFEDEELSGSDSFYSIPSTDDEDNSKTPQRSGEGRPQTVSPVVRIHAVNVCDQAIVDNTARQMAKHANASFHSNPRSAVEDPMAASQRGVRLNTDGLASSRLAILSTPESDMYDTLRTTDVPFTILLDHVDGVYTASVDGIVLGRMLDTVIMRGGSDTLLMSIQKEAGHPVHVHPMLVTPKKQVRYILRRGRLSNEFSVFDIHGDRTVVTTKDMKGKCAGEKVLKYTISKWPGSKDLRDWHLWRKGNRHGEDFLMWKDGNKVEVSTRMQQDGNSPETIVSLVLALTTLWFAPCAK